MSDSGPGRPSKVKRLLEKYELSSLGAELEARWTGETGERSSLRDLAEHVNQQVLRATMENAGMEMLDGEVENTYRLLTDEDVSSGVRTQTERQLERHGIAVDALRDDFVSYQAVRTYLKKHRNAEYTPESTDQVRQSHQTVQQLVTRTETIATHKLEHLRDTDRIELGDFRVSATVHVYCTDCGTRYELDALMDERACECP